MSKEESKAIQGIGILMMCYLHLYGLPERIHFPYQSFFPLHLQSQFACTLKICVCIYAFISGYGLCKKSMHLTEKSSLAQGLLIDYKMIIKKALIFLGHYWMIFLIFVPIRFILFHQPFSAKEFWSNFFGFSWTYNSEWWYVAQYIKLLLLYPIIRFFLLLLKGKKFFSISLAMLGGVILIFSFKRCLNMGFHELFKIVGIAYLLAFVEGISIAQFEIYDKVKKLGKKNIQIGASICIVALVLAIRLNIDRDALLASSTDFLFLPFLCYAFSYLYSVLKQTWIKRTMLILGEHSTFIWLTHTFYAYYYFQKIVFLPYLSFLIFIWLILLSFMSSYIIKCVSKTILEIIVKRR